MNYSATMYLYLLNLHISVRISGMDIWNLLFKMISCTRPFAIFKFLFSKKFITELVAENL